MAASNIIEILIKAKDDASDIVGGVVDSVSSKFESMSRTLLTAGAGLAVLTAPMLAGLYDATNQAVAFDEAMTNVQAIIRTTDEETAALSDTILDLGASSRYGPQALAESYYDIVGGVADASAHMDILNASVTVAQAGNADLGASTSALISVMNSYQFAADQAGMVSDVLVQTVAKGVGTMDEFSSALPQVTGVAASMGISLEDVGAQMAYMTTQGFSANQSATYLRSAMTSMMNPTTELAEVIAGLGYESGSAMVEAMGLSGAFDAIKTAGGGSFDGIITSQEALMAALSLTSEGADSFIDNFTIGLDGIAEATEAIQMDSPAAQMDLFKSSVSALKIEIGEALIPVLNQMLGVVQPVISAAVSWARQNPKLIATIAGVVGGVAALAGVLGGVGAVIGAIVPAIALLTGPFGLLIALAGALYFAFDRNLFGIQDIFNQVVGTVRGFVEEIRAMYEAGASAGQIIEAVALKLGMSNDQFTMLSTTLGIVAATVGTFVTGSIVPAISDFADMLAVGIPIAAQATASFVTGTLVPALLIVGSFIVGTVIPAFVEVANWLSTNIPAAIALVSGFWTSTLQPALQAVWMFIQGSVLPVFGDVAAWLSVNIPTAVTAAQTAWETTLKPALEKVSMFVTDTVIPALTDIGTWLSTNIPTAIDTVKTAWETVFQPAIEDISNFITTTAVPAFQKVYDFLYQQIPAAITKITTDIYGALQPAFLIIGEFVTTTVVPGLQKLSEFFQTHLPTAIQFFKTIWDTILKPVLETGADFITNTLLVGLQSFYDFFQLHLPNALAFLVTAWDTVLMPVLQVGSTFLADTFVATLQRVYDFWAVYLPGAIDILKGAWDTVLYPAIEDVGNFITTTLIPAFQDIYKFAFTDIPNGLQTMADKINSVAYPAIDDFKKLINDVTEGFRGVKSIVEELSGNLEKLGDLFSEIGDAIPDALIPGSPTPFEIGLWGIHSAMNAINSQSLPSFGDEMNAAGSALPPGVSDGEFSGGRSISITINVDAATVNDTANTQQNAANLAREIEMALGAVG